MQLSEDRTNRKNAKQWSHCTPNKLVPYEYEWTCFSCGYNVREWKNCLGKIQQRKINFVNRLKNAERKSMCYCIDVY